MIERIMKWMNGFAAPFSKALRKSPAMVRAKTEADILKAEEDFKKDPRPEKLKKPDSDKKR